MNPHDWLSCKDPRRLLENLNSLPVQPSSRKLRLFNIACCRNRLQGFNNAGRTSIIYAEKLAEVQPLPFQQDVFDNVAESHLHHGIENCYVRAAYCLWLASPLAAALGVVTHLSGQERHRHERPRQAILLKEIIGNPWFPIVTERAYHTEAGAKAYVCSCVQERCLRLAEPRGEEFESSILQHILRESWLTWQEGKVVRLAQAAYEERLGDGFLDPVRMLILADALEESGCDLPIVLDHCRRKGFIPQDAPFCRGDFVLDAILGKG